MKLEELIPLLEAQGYPLAFYRHTPNLDAWQAGAQVDTSTYVVGMGPSFEEAADSLWNQIKERPKLVAAPKNLSLDDLFDAGTDEHIRRDFE